MDPIEAFKSEVESNIESLGSDADQKALALQWMMAISPHRYTHNFQWLGRPIIQFPQDMVAVQQLIWDVKPDLVIETGIAHGGSLILSASLLAMLDLTECLESGNVYDPAKSSRKVVGVDIDIREHNKEAVENHPFARYISMVEGSSISEDTIEKVSTIAASYNRVMVFLDSNHTHDHVLAELEAYAPLTSKGSYCVVFDTLIEDLPEEFFPDRPWGVGDNPKTALRDYLSIHPEFESNTDIDHMLSISVAPEGFLKRVS